MDELLNGLQWPAMIVTLTAAWLVASRSSRKRTVGFWCFIASNILAERSARGDDGAGRAGRHRRIFTVLLLRTPIVLGCTLLQCLHEFLRQIADDQLSHVSRSVPR